MLKFRKRIITLSMIIFIVIYTFTKVYAVETEVGNQIVNNEENNINNMTSTIDSKDSSALIGGMFGGLLGALLSNADWNENINETENNPSYEPSLYSSNENITESNSSYESSLSNSNENIIESNFTYQESNNQNILNNNTNITQNYNCEIWFNTLNEYLKSLGLSEKNLYMYSETNKGNIKIKYYYLKYEGHIFKDMNYKIYFDNENHVIKETFINKNYDVLIPKIELVEEKYQTLDSIDLKMDLNGNIYDVFDYYNEFSSIEKLREFIRRCEFSQDEINKNMDMLEKFYSEYLKNNTIKKYSKSEIINVYNEFKYNMYATEMARNNHIDKITKEVKDIEAYTEQYQRNMVQNNHINNSDNIDGIKNVGSKKIVSEIPNSGSQENRYVIALGGIILTSVLCIILFIFIGKTNKNSKKI